jgi:VWFA-related protein
VPRPLLALFVAWSLTLSGTAPSATQIFRSRTQGIRVDALVTDRGRPIDGLTADDFEIYDNGVRQTIALADFDQLPLNVVLTFDMSGSVSAARLGHLQQAAKALLDGLTTQDRAGLVTFSHEVNLGAKLTGDLNAVRTAIGLTRPAGGTALVDGVYAGITLGESGVGRGLLIAFSDGLDTASWLEPDPVLETAKRADIVAYAVSVGQQRQDFLRDLAEATGGQIFENESSEHLERIFVAVLNEFRRRYVLMYTPTSFDPGWHRLEVRLKGRRGSIKARPGYLADSAVTGFK